MMSGSGELGSSLSILIFFFKEISAHTPAAHNSSTSLRSYCIVDVVIFTRDAVAVEHSFAAGRNPS